MPEPVRVQSEDGEKARLAAEKRIKEDGARLLNVRRRLKDYIAN